MEEERYVDKVNEGRIKYLKDIKEIQAWQSENSDKDLQDNADYVEPLCVDTQLIKLIRLSVGGPSDGFKLYFFVAGNGVQREYELSHGVYYREDWGEYKESLLTDEDAQTIYDFYLGGEIIEEG